MSKNWCVRATLSDVGTLLVNGNQDIAGGRVKADGGMIVTDAPHNVADDLGTRCYHVRT